MTEPNVWCLLTPPMQSRCHNNLYTITSDIPLYQVACLSSRSYIWMYAQGSSLDCLKPTHTLTAVNLLHSHSDCQLGSNKFRDPPCTRPSRTSQKIQSSRSRMVWQPRMELCFWNISYIPVVLGLEWGLWSGTFQGSWLICWRFCLQSCSQPGL